MNNTTSKTNLIVFQSTPFCNLDCSYCYLPNRNDKSRASIEDIRDIFSKVLSYPTVQDRVSVVWHAGEPLVVGPKYYEEAFSVIDECRPAGLRIDHSVQTNGTLVTDEYCALFKKWNVNVGVSIDGPRDVNDAHRKYRNGRGSFDDVIKGIRCLQKNDVSFYVIAVVTDKSINQPTEMLEFFKKHEIRQIAFNIEEVESVNVSSSLDATDRSTYAEFLSEFWKQAVEGGSNISVREVERSIGLIKNYAEVDETKNDQVSPFGIISIDSMGNLSTFSPELLSANHDNYRNFHIGNCVEDSFNTISKSQALTRIYQDVRSGVEACRSECGYFSVCGGGSPVNKLFENGSFSSTETLFCKMNIQALVDMALRWTESYS